MRGRVRGRRGGKWEPGTPRCLLPGALRSGAASAAPLPSAVKAAAEALVVLSPLWISSNSQRGRAGWCAALRQSAGGLVQAGTDVKLFSASLRPLPTPRQTLKSVPRAVY